MTVRELISELLQYPNLDAEVNLTSNIIDSENEAFDNKELAIDFFQQDVEDATEYDIVLYNNKKIGNDKDSIHNLLDAHGEITIKLSNNGMRENIVVIEDKTNAVLREIDVCGNYTQTENVVKILESIL